MADNLIIPKELDALIQEYLTDGVLTDKERQVILDEAEKLGLGRDKIDLYLDAQVQKIDQQTDAAVRRQKGKTCPYCGGSIPLLTDKCPHCGENITAEASAELQEIFDNLEEALVDLKSGKDSSRSKATVERYARKAKMYYGSNPKIQKLLAEVEAEMNEAEKKIKSAAQKQGVISIITNKWLWVLLELIVFGVLFGTALKEHNEANARYEYYKAQQYAHPDEGDDTSGHRSAEYTQIVANKNKAYDETKSPMYIIYLLLGIGVAGFTAKLAIDDSKKQNK